jgi:CRP-like cAMP-binding protein
MEQLLKAISKYIKVSENLRKDLESRLNFETFKKREIILDESHICTKSYFIQQGILRLYYLKDGKEIAEFFCSENEWINSPKSFLKRELDEYYIDSIEDSQVWSLHLNDLMDLFNRYPEMERYARMDMGSSFIYFMDRLAIARFSTALEKYQHFLKTYQDIHHRIPLGMAASYIGITQETLSRLRKGVI